VQHYSNTNISRHGNFLPRQGVSYGFLALDTAPDTIPEKKERVVLGKEDPGMVEYSSRIHLIWIES